MSSQIFLSRAVADHEPADVASPPDDATSNNTPNVLEWLHAISTSDSTEAHNTDHGAIAGQVPAADVMGSPPPRAQYRRRLSQLLQEHWASHMPYSHSKTLTREYTERIVSILKTKPPTSKEEANAAYDNNGNKLPPCPTEGKDTQRSKKRLRFDLLSELPALSKKIITDIIYQSMTSPRSGPFRKRSLSVRLIKEDLECGSDVAAATATSSDSAAGDLIMSGALPLHTEAAADFVLSGLKLDTLSCDSSELAFEKTNSSYSLHTLTTSASQISELPSPLVPSTTAVHHYKIGSHPPCLARHASLPLGIEGMATRPKDASGSPTAALPAVVSRPVRLRSHSAPETSMHSRHRRQKRATLPDTLLGSVLMFLNYDDYKALQMAWKLGSPDPVIPEPIVHRLPTETIQHIFQYLSPSDFNVARGSCESWYSASLDVKLLTMQLRRGGWWTAGQQDLKDMQVVPQMERLRAIQIVLSVRLAKECALVNKNKNQNRNLILGPFFQVATVDFTLLHTKSGIKDPRNLLFTVSTCGRYVLVARDRRIFVYAFRSTSLEPYGKITCPRTVLAVAMDASPKQHVVAALLEGRIGIVANVLDGERTRKVGQSDGHGPSPSSLADSQPLKVEHPQQDNTSSSSLLAFNTSYNASALSSNSEASVSRGHPYGMRFHAGSTRRAASTDRNQPSLCSACGHRHYRAPKRGSSNSGRRLQGGDRAKFPSHEATFPFVVTSPQHMYRHLGSDSDPPRSVAVCPSRRCVAFGFSNGMEIHWIEVATKQEHNRWFPLTAPADFLYFLPSATNADSANKLRLLSSIAPSEERSDLGVWRLARRATSGLSNVWGVTSNSARYETAPTWASRQTARSSSNEKDYHRAVPLSDGFHYLFTDKSNLLWLGSDVPFDGQTKLSRLTLFIPPRRVAQSQQANDKSEPGPSRIPLPTSYTAATDLTRGVRVVAAYGSDLVFYTVPPDVLAQSFALPRRPSKNQEHNAPKPPTSRGGSLASLLDEPALNTDWLDWWPSPPDNWVLPPMKRHTFPLPVQGIYIGRLEEGVSDISISVGQDNEGGTGDSDMVIWAFSRSGEKAAAWTFVDGGDGGNVRVVSSKVGNHGSVSVVESWFVDEV